MNGHPGGEAHTRRMLALADLQPGASVLDMGAGGGEAVKLMQSLGHDARGIDREIGGEGVEQGDFLHLPYPDGSFDAVLSQCAFFVSGDVPGALKEAHRVLKSGGKLLLSDVFFEEPGPLLQKAGFEILHAEDVTDAWQEYYLEALWRDEAPCCRIPRGRCHYKLLICVKK